MTYSLGCIPLIINLRNFHKQTLIDHVYTNNVVDAGKSFILVSDMSDHFPVVVNSNLNLPKHDKSEISYIRDTKNFDMKLFLQD